MDGFAVEVLVSVLCVYNGIVDGAVDIEWDGSGMGDDGDHVGGAVGSGSDSVVVGVFGWQLVDRDARGDYSLGVVGYLSSVVYQFGGEEGWGLVDVK